jgi:mitochondrial import inner membrane translocase subunit TIM21
MLRSTSLGITVASRRTIVSAASRRAASRFVRLQGEQQQYRSLLMPSSSALLNPTLFQSRVFSSEANHNKNPKSTDGNSSGDDDVDTKELVLTPGQKVAAASRLGMWVGILGFASCCAYYIARELIPTKMSPNTVFNRAIDVIRSHDQVKRQYGESGLKFYGRDHGSHREGRRNFIEHTDYTSPEDGTKRTRVRFNMESQFASAFCFAEVSSEMPSGEFVYVLVQDKQSGRVITVVDNRAALTAQRLAGGNTETASAMQQLLSGSGSGSGQK